jgi:sugar phosphate isomerase/epimerase
MNLLSSTVTVVTLDEMTWRGAFSTLGCSGRPLAEVVRLAREGGWDGLELRAASGEPVHVGLTPAERVEVRGTLAAGGVTPLAVASYVEVDDPRLCDAAVVEETLAHVALAADLGAPFVRVFPGGPSLDGAALRRLRAIAARLDEHPGVAVAVETHDSRATGSAVAELLAPVDHPRLRAVWDVQHPWRAGEAVRDTLDALGPFLAYVQITDARSDDDVTPCLLGTGVLPLLEARAELARRRYHGWISLEWASHWYPAAPPLVDALPGARRWLDGALR